MMDTEENRAVYSEAGIHYLLTKPTQPDALKDMLRTLHQVNETV